MPVRLLERSKLGMKIEVCVASLDAALVAEQAGADRIELNCALELDGLTPSAGLVQQVTAKTSLPMIAMARPRGGGFCYSASEWETLLADARWLLKHGAAGIAFGCLDSTGQIDQVRCRQIRELAAGAELVFHKAFDEVSNWSAALDTLIECGVDRVMSSGLMATAIEGAPTLSAMVKQAAGRIEILPAGRIGSENARQIVKITNCDQLHGSFSSATNRDTASEIAQTIAQFPSAESDR